MAPSAEAIQALLSQLRDIHLPTAVGWWPLAWGWWLLLVLLLLLASLFIGLYWRRKLLAEKPAALALLELQSLARRYNAGEGAALVVSELSVLLRRVALSYFPRARVASMTGDVWLKWMDDCVGEPLFCSADHAALISAPYQAQTDTDVHALLQASRRWLLLMAQGLKQPC